jgi:hypothetical protein
VKIFQSTAGQNKKRCEKRGKEEQHIKRRTQGGIKIQRYVPMNSKMNIAMVTPEKYGMRKEFLSKKTTV